MIFDNKNINYSNSDLKRKITLPSEMSSQLSEIIGIILGDGHLDRKKYSSTFMYRLIIAGSHSDDFDYYNKRINPMFFKMFNTSFNLSKFRNNELVIRLYSKAIVSFMENIGIPVGKKVDINKIPYNIIKCDEKIIISLIRGVFDTESSISFKKYKKYHSKPTIKISMKSKEFINQIRGVLNKMKFNLKYYQENIRDSRNGNFHIRYTIDINGKKKLAKFLEVIGFNNPRHLTKVKIYEIFGFCPPYTTYQQRLDILSGKLNPYNFYKD